MGSRNGHQEMPFQWKAEKYLNLHLSFLVTFDPFVLPFCFLSRLLQIRGDMEREDARWSPVWMRKRSPLGGLSPLGIRQGKQDFSSYPAFSWSPLWYTVAVDTVDHFSCLPFLSTDSLVSGRPGLPKHKQAHTQACWWWLVKPDFPLLCTNFIEADIYFCSSSSPFISHSPQNNQGQVCPSLAAHASPAVPSLLSASLPAQLLPWSSAGSRAADVQSRMESSLALPCCVGSARLTEYILVCVWKFNSCSSGTQKTDLQRETILLFSPANHNHPFCPEKRRHISSSENLNFPASAPNENP